MHVQVINFGLEDMSPTEFFAVCDELAPTWAGIPGLISKIWLSNPETNTYGGVYLWRDRAAMEAFVAGELFAAIAANPHFTGASSRDFDVIDGPTRVTRGDVAAALI
jgi:hypothetical protein